MVQQRGQPGVHAGRHNSTSGVWAGSLSSVICGSVTSTPPGAAGLCVARPVISTTGLDRCPAPHPGPADHGRRPARARSGPHDQEGHRGQNTQTVYPALDLDLTAGSSLRQLGSRSARNACRFSSMPCMIVTSSPERGPGGARGGRGRGATAPSPTRRYAGLNGPYGASDPCWEGVFTEGLLSAFTSTGGSWSSKSPRLLGLPSRHRRKKNRAGRRSRSKAFHAGHGKSCTSAERPDCPDSRQTTLTGRHRATRP